MGAFTNRTIMPVEVSHPSMPGPLLSFSQSGVSQARSTSQVGRRWTETYGLIDGEGATGRAFLAEVNQLYRAGTIFNLVHPLMDTQLGAGGGTPKVNGGSQTGVSLLSDGWPNSTLVLKAGDVIYFSATPIILFDVTSDVTSNGSGEAAIPINPPIFAGGSPADNADISITVSFRVRLIDVQMPVGSVETKGMVRGLRITVQESLV